ncbi:sodium/hydrogen antiporter, variant [Verruconis gallopava]|uniref:Sodium/hydrogen antiporter n=1 Tax=Verruconis gallopava TaxID=253628 RepID=A0A0D1YT36_9PEZI|nr:sodium/hydrogen antiporter [Verruconis gallopava]XP_016213672.1 sodium/hydrogen antiporter, variant [Verruconis gallopava]KIW03802.1 sodium/hydrogen antiporter [Verruconis gallopava]KIW03803.1 sodium/hydrogen antiporter, variant [Verruconis gallopava]
MAWEHLDINRPHLVYIILGGFTSLFMLCSSVIKERLYIGEATVATLCGIIFGPHAANLINPLEWGNTDQITLEFSRIVLVVQCFAVGVELPKNYMEKHWKSVTLLLVPVMTWGYFLTSLFIWWMFGHRLSWLDSLCIAACVTATDPVLASSVVGKGKFAKRVPKHLRDLLSAESGCNDGMAFPFVYLAIYLIRYRPDAGKVSFHWICYTILYECIFGAVYGVIVGYAARRAIRAAHEHDLIDRESFLVFYFVLALFCAGSGSMLGMDDLLIGFACGVGFSNDGWFQEKTEESHVSNVIDLLINLAFFVYFGTIIPWEQFNSDILGISPWRLVVVGILVLLFRRIPIMLLLKPVIPDIKTWREALFAGHFGPIGVGALFVSILARAEMETEGTTPLAVLPEPGFEHMNIIEMIWPITTFLVIVSIVIHGSSVAVFTLGRRINTLAISVSFTKGNDEGPSWMERLPRIQSRSKSSMSLRRPDDTESDLDEKLEEGMLSPSAIPRNFLRRLKDDDAPSRASSVKASRRRKKWDAGVGPGGPVSQSAITPAPRLNSEPENGQSESETLVLGGDETPGSQRKHASEPEVEVYREGDHDIVEDEDGNVLEVREVKQSESEEERDEHIIEDGKKLIRDKNVVHGTAQTEHEQDDTKSDDKIGKEAKRATESKSDASASAAHVTGSSWLEKTKKYSGMTTLSGLRKKEEVSRPEKKHGPALAYQFGNTIIVEDEDGEVIKKYDIPAQSRPGADRKTSFLDQTTRRNLERMGTWVGMGHRKHPGADSEAGPSSHEGGDKKSADDGDDDETIRFTLGGSGRRMSKADFIQAVSRLDPKTRQRMIDESDAPDHIKREASSAVASDTSSMRRPVKSAHLQRVPTEQDRPAGPDGLALIDSNEESIPFHPISDTLARYNLGGSGGETAAQRRRRQAQKVIAEEDSEGPHDEPRGRSRGDRHTSASPSRRPTVKHGQSYLDDGETAAERRRRLAALEGGGDDSSSEEEEGGQGFREIRPRGAPAEPTKPAPSHQRGPSIRFAEPKPQQSSSSNQGQGQGQSRPSSGGTSMRLRWGSNVGKKPSGSKK